MPLNFHPVNILMLIREHQRISLKRLRRAFGMRPPKRGQTQSGDLRYALTRLRAGGLIAFESDEGREEEPFAFDINGDITLTRRWEEIRSALDISLRDLSELTREDTIIARPFLGVPEEQREWYDVFVLMPFSKQLRPVFDDHIMAVARRLNLKCARADDLFSTHAVVRDVWQGIVFSRVVVADCTGRNPNVFYEVGLAHALGRPVVLMTQDKEDVPFDVRHVRFIPYTFTGRGMMECERLLTKTLQTVLALPQRPRRRSVVTAAGSANVANKRARNSP